MFTCTQQNAASFCMELMNLVTHANWGLRQMTNDPFIKWILTEVLHPAVLKATAQDGPYLSMDSQHDLTLFKALKLTMLCVTMATFQRWYEEICFRLEWQHVHVYLLSVLDMKLNVLWMQSISPKVYSVCLKKNNPNAFLQNDKYSLFKCLFNR